MNLLSNVSDVFINVVAKNIDPISLNWIGKIVKAIIEGVGITALGIFLFTLILKTIVLPLDIYSKYKTKKQSLLMEQMRPQMEKLQKQYANDQAMYNQKVQELYKKNGYSMLGVCLPTIVSLVIFMVVFSQFSTYSQYANLETYREMVDAYNNKITEYVLNEEHPDGFLIETVDYSAIEEVLDDGTVVYSTAYFVDYDSFIKYYNNDTRYLDYYGYDKLSDDYFDGMTSNEAKNFVENYIKIYAREKAADAFTESNDGFLWIGNIWYPDSMLNKVVPSFSKFQSTLSRADIDDNYEESYNEVTYNLSEEKDTYNGYFVLIIIAIGMMLLSQFVSMRMQKSMNDLGTVDGSGSRNTKWMMILMPIMYGIFSFFYSAAFSIYMITNTTYSLVTSLVINAWLNRKFKKLEEQNELDKYLHKTKEKKKK